MQEGGSSGRPHAVLLGTNLGSRTLFMTIPMHTFYEMSEVANERNIEANKNYEGELIAQRKLDPKHAEKLASYILKGLFQTVEVRYASQSEELPSGFKEMKKHLGEQPYLSLQPITANIRSCKPGGEDLQFDKKADGKVIVYLSNEHVLWVVDGQHRRFAMQMVFDFFKFVIANHKYPKRPALYPHPDDENEMTTDELRVWTELFEVARSKCTVAAEVHLGLNAEQERQLFHDLNNLTKKIESSLAFQFDNSNPVNLFIKNELIDKKVLEADVVEKDVVDWHKDQGVISRKDLIAINAILFLNKTNISGAKPAAVTEKEDFARRFWQTINDIPGFGEASAKKKTVAAQPVVLKALAKLAYDFGYGRSQDAALLDTLLDGISTIDFSHDEKMWRYYQLSEIERKQECPGLDKYLPPEGDGANRDIGSYDDKEKVMRFGAKHNDIYPILGDMIRWRLNLPIRHQKKLVEELLGDLA